MTFPSLVHAGAGLLAVFLWCVAPAATAARAPDFNGDGIDDFLFRDRTVRDHRLVVALGARNIPGGGARRSLLLSTDVSRQRGFDVRTGDFDGDGRTDLLDRDLASGQYRVRLLNGTNVRVTGALTGIPASAELRAVADFNADRRDDLLVQSPVSGVWSIFIMNGAAADLSRSGEAGFARSPLWRLTGTADFNGDGRADLLLRRSDTLAWQMVLLDGRTALRIAAPAFLDTSWRWRLEAIADFDRDGRTDLLMRDRATGAWQTWFLAGTSARLDSGPTAIATGLAWKLQAVSDLNSDGFPDALLARHDTGEWRAEFLMQRARLAGSGLVARLPVATQRIAATGDFDGDGRDDVLFTDNDSWEAADLGVPGAPVFAPVDSPGPGQWPVACETAETGHFGKPPRPASATSNTAFLSWTRPTTRDNGEALCSYELAGFFVRYYRREGGSSVTLRLPNPAVESRLVGPLVAGTWMLQIQSYDTLGRVGRASPYLAKTVP